MYWVKLNKLLFYVTSRTWAVQSQPATVGEHAVIAAQHMYDAGSLDSSDGVHSNLMNLLMVTMCIVRNIPSRPITAVVLKHFCINGIVWIPVKLVKAAIATTNLGVI